MRLLIIVFTASVSVLVFGDVDNFFINPIQDASTCEPIIISWSGGMPPYKLFEHFRDSGNNSAGLIQEGINTTKYTWMPGFPIEHQVIIEVIDERMNNHLTNAFTIHNGTDHSCLIGAKSQSSMASTRTINPTSFPGTISTSLSSTAIKDAPIVAAPTMTTSLSYSQGSSIYDRARGAIITGSVFGGMCMLTTTVIIYKTRRRRTRPRPGKAWVILDDETADKPPSTDELAFTIEPFMKTVARPESAALHTYRPRKARTDDIIPEPLPVATLGMTGTALGNPQSPAGSQQDMSLRDRMDTLLAEVYRLNSAMMSSSTFPNAPPAYDGPDAR